MRTTRLLSLILLLAYSGAFSAWLFLTAHFDDWSSVAFDGAACLWVIAPVILAALFVRGARTSGGAVGWLVFEMVLVVTMACAWLDLFVLHPDALNLIGLLVVALWQLVATAIAAVVVAGAKWTSKIG